MRSVLIVCNDALGEKMAGPSIRCTEMAGILARYFSVAVAATRVANFETAEFKVYAHASADFKGDAERADVIIVQGDGLTAHPFLKRCRGVLIADLYCPVPLEYHQASSSENPIQRARTLTFLSDLLREQLVYADHFLCASERQKDFWLGALTLAGRINAHRWPEAARADVADLLTQLPFGLPSEQPVLQRHALRSMFGIPADDFVMVWGGGLYQWFDPLTIIRAVHRLTQDGIRVHLVFMGVKHPNTEIEPHGMSAQAVDLATELGLNGTSVHFNFGWVDYHDRHNFLMDADVGVSAHFDNPETRFSFRTRMLDYLWCGLPIIATRGDVFADDLQRHDIGIAVGFEDVDGWTLAIKALIKDPGSVARYRGNVGSYAQQYRWSHVMAPFVQLCSTITMAPDRAYIRSNGSFMNRLKSQVSRALFILQQRGPRTLISAVMTRLRRMLR